MTNHRIRTTINPAVVLTVDDAELTDLTRQGLVLDEAKSAKLDEADAAAKAAADAEAETDKGADVAPAKKGK